MIPIFIDINLNPMMVLIIKLESEPHEILFFNINLKSAMRNLEYFNNFIKLMVICVQS